MGDTLPNHSGNSYDTNPTFYYSRNYYLNSYDRNPTSYDRNPTFYYSSNSYDRNPRLFYAGTEGPWVVGPAETLSVLLDGSRRP